MNAPSSWTGIKQAKTQKAPKQGAFFLYRTTRYSAWKISLRNYTGEGTPSDTNLRLFCHTSLTFRYVCYIMLVTQKCVIHNADAICVSKR